MDKELFFLGQGIPSFLRFGTDRVFELHLTRLDMGFGGLGTGIDNMHAFFYYLNSLIIIIHKLSTIDIFVFIKYY